MENRFYDNEFEKYLKEEADDYRMYPSDHVWRNIQQEIHGYRKWPALTIIAVFIISALVVGTVLVKPHKDTAIIAQTAKPVSKDLNHTNQSIKLTAKNQQHQYLSPVKNQQQPFEKISEPNIKQQEPESEMTVTDNLTMPLPDGIAVVLKAPVGAIITPEI
ncbi:MAG: hypothetical protein IAF38_17345, partial [Bacteroidia bacterium]|nr:hypothetical protein [Bacteroidia bacterium]